MQENGQEGALLPPPSLPLSEAQAAQQDEPRLPKRRTRASVAAAGMGPVDAVSSNPRDGEALPRKRRRNLEAGGPSGELSAELASMELPGQAVSSSEQEGAPLSGEEDPESAAAPRAPTGAESPACNAKLLPPLSESPQSPPGAVSAAALAGAAQALGHALQGSPPPPCCAATPPAQPALPSLPEGHPLMLDDLPSSTLLHLGQRILALYKQHHQWQAQRSQHGAAAHDQQQQHPEQAGNSQQPRPQQQQQQLRPSTPVQHPWAGLAGPGSVLSSSPSGSIEEAYRRITRFDEELSMLRAQLAAAQRALSAQEGARVVLVAELEWAREAAAGAQAQRGAMEVLMAKNAELQEQVRTLGSRQHMLQQQLVAAMAARERRHAEAQALAADKEGLQVLLTEAGARQRALHTQVAELEGRTHRAEQELSGVRAARDWLAPRLEAALTGKAAVEEELRATRARLDRANAELALWRAQARQGADSGGPSA